MERSVKCAGILVLIGVCCAGCQLDRRPTKPEEGSLSLATRDPGVPNMPVGSSRSTDNGELPGAPVEDKSDSGMGPGPTTAAGGAGPCDCKAPGCSRPGCGTPQRDGAPCVMNGECTNGHCDSGVCCADGQCCLTDGECGAGADNLVCESHGRCEGARGTATCVAFRCRTGRAGLPDDSACGATVEASDCGPYPSVFCSSAPEQSTPACADHCQADDDCDREAHCSDGGCQPDADTGQPCETHGQCLSRYCDRGVCCEAGSDCGPCQSNGDCDKDAVCRVNGTCGACEKTNQCDTGVCRLNGTCGPACDETHQCSMGEYCDDNTCVPACNDNECNGVCGPDNRCTDKCAGPSDCSAATHQCVDGKCVQGCDDDDCNGLCGAENTCTDACQAMSDCFSSHTCAGGKCVPYCAPGNCIPYVCNFETQKCRNACGGNGQCTDGFRCAMSKCMPL